MSQDFAVETEGFDRYCRALFEAKVGGAASRIFVEEGEFKICLFRVAQSSLSLVALRS